MSLQHTPRRWRAAKPGRARSSSIFPPMFGRLAAAPERAGRADRSLRLVELQAAWFPCKATPGHELARRAFQIGHGVLVIQFQQGHRQNLPPVLRDRGQLECYAARRKIEGICRSERIRAGPRENLSSPFSKHLSHGFSKYSALVRGNRRGGIRRGDRLGGTRS